MQPRPVPMVKAVEAAAVGPADPLARRVGVGLVDRAAADSVPRTNAAMAEGGGADEELADLLEVDVRVEWPDGRAAPEAELWFLSPRTVQQAWADDDELDRVRDDEVVLRARGTKVAVDSDGKVHLRAYANGPVCGRSGEHFATTRLDTIDATKLLHLVLKRDVNLEVRVVDERGGPRAEFDLGLRTRFTRRSGGFADQETVQLPPTDSNGVTRFAHLQIRSPLPGPDVLDWSCVLFGTRRATRVPECAVTVDMLLSGRPILWEVGRGGIVEVAVVDGGGAPSREDLRLVDLVSEDWFEPDIRGASVARFTDVPLMRRWRLEVQRAGKVVHAIELSGPDEPGELVHVPVVLPYRRVALTLVVECENGEVAHGATVDVRGEIAGGLRDGTRWSSESTAVRSNEKTECALWLGNGERLVHARVLLRHPSLIEGLEKPLPFAIQTDLDLGRFVLPLPRAQEELLRLRVTLAGRVVTSTAGFDLDGKQHGMWTWNVSESVLEGEYRVVRGLTAPNGFRLVVRHAGAMSVAREVRSGDVIDLELEPSAELIVPVHMSRLPEVLLEAHLLAGDERLAGHVHDDGTLVWPQLRPGFYSLSVSCAGREILRRALPHLAPGRSVWPSWDEPIDLCRLAKVVRLQVRGVGNTEPSYWSHFVVRPRSRTLPENWLEDRDPHWVLVDEASADELVVWARGHLPVRVALSNEDLDLELRPATRLLVRAGDTRVQFHVDVTRPGLADPLLHAVVEGLADRSQSYDLSPGGSEEFEFAPGTELVLRVHQGSGTPREQKVVVGAVDPQLVELR